MSKHNTPQHNSSDLLDENQEKSHYNNGGRHERYLRCLADIATLLQLPGDSEDKLSKIVERLQEVTGACRCYLFENYISTDGDTCSRQRFESCAPGITRQIENPVLQQFNWKENRMERWPQMLSRGEIISGEVSDLPEEEQHVLEEQDIKRILELPLFVEGNWWGFIGFDACRDDVIWSREEEELLETAAHAIGSYLERIKTENERSIFNQMLRSLAAVGDLEGIVKVVQEVTEQLFHWDAHYFAVRPPEKKSFQVISFFDSEQDGAKKRFPIHGFKEARPIEHTRSLLKGKPVLINRTDSSSSPRLSRFGNKDRLSASLMYAPVKVGSQIIGIISVQSYTPGQYNEDELHILDQLADAVSPVLERAFSEQKKKEREEQIQLVVQSLPVIVFSITTGNPKTVFITPNVKEVTGYSRSDFVKNPDLWMQIVYPEDRKIARKVFREISEENYPVDFKFRIKTKQGDIRWMRERVSPGFDERGKIVRYDGIAEDITERIRSEETLRYRLKFENLISNISTNFINLSPDQINAGIDSALSEVGKFADADRASIFIFGKNGQNVVQIYHWISEAMKADLTRKRSFTTEEIPWFMNELNQFRVIHIPDVDALPPEAERTREILRNYDVLSCTVVPLVNKGVLFGFLGFEWVKHKKDLSEEIITVLKIIGEIFMNAVEKQKVENALRESQERYALAVRGANDGLWDWNLVTNDIYLSPRWKSMLGYDEHEIENNPVEWFQRVHPDDTGRLQGAIQAHLKGRTEHFENEYRIQHQDGSYRWMLSRGLAVRDNNWKAYRMVGSQSDIHDRKVAEERLLHDAFHDELTGLANRALFIDRVEQAISRSRRRPEYRFSVLYLDIDRFKNVNDSLGHKAGDRLLLFLSKRLRECLRPGDTVGRISGDEFALLLEEVGDSKSAAEAAERIKNSVSGPYHLNDHEIFITVSIGAAIGTSEYLQPEHIVRDADTAMYQAKTQGRGNYALFDEIMHSTMVEMWRTEMDLRKALERGELLLHYQPIVEIATGRIMGYEALVRWNHPVKGLLSAGEFVSIAEETGLISSIGDWALEKACLQLKEWRNRYSNEKYSMYVNLFSRQLTKSELPDLVKSILKKTDLEPDALKIEITERAIMENTEVAMDLLNRLKSLNVHLLVDDFGTGYSSLSYLQIFPLDALKIDRSFVQRLTHDEESREIVQAIITMASNLNIELVAEGIETRSQSEILKKMGCRCGQGYFFHPPLDPERAGQLIEVMAELN